jgi:hypothetical protein
MINPPTPSDALMWVPYGPKGLYHRKGDDSCGVYRDGQFLFGVPPEFSGAAAALIVLLNSRP